MVPTLSWRIGDFTLADAGNVAVPTPEGPMASHPGGSEAAVNGHGLTLRPFPRSRSNHDCKRQSRVNAAAPRGQRRGFRRGDCR
jgi:hypothetical protein